MTPEQYNRWKDFSLRMARTLYRTVRRPSGKWIVEMVEDFFGWTLDEDDIVCLVDWDNSDEYPEGHRLRCQECGGKYPRWTSPYCVGDMMSVWLGDYHNYVPCCPACKNGHGKECRCEDVRELFYEQWDDQWGGPIRCCIRAGLDFASAPSAGVMGFTAGDVRTMYPEGVPDWVKNGQWYPAFSETREDGTKDGIWFDDMKDSHGILM